MTVTPSTQFSQLLNFGVLVLNIIFDRKSGGIIYSNIAAESEKYSGYLVCEQFGV
jgi:hypothetical protein